MHPFFKFLNKLPDDQLPGQPAQKEMFPAPSGQHIIRPPFSDKGGYPSAVLIPLYAAPGDAHSLHVILTLRAKTIRHAGQISFPGGRKEGNEPLQSTALRETHEEIGILPDLVTVAREITPLYLERTHNHIQPFVGFLDKKPAMKRNPDEVQEIIIVSFDELLDNKSIKNELWNLEKVKYNVPFWDIHQIPLWGATAMIMSELLELYKRFLSQTRNP